MNARKVGTLLAVLFLISLTSATIYSRGCAVRQRPFVHITLPLEGTLFWDYETRSTMRSATDEEAEKGHTWITEIILSYETFRYYIDKNTAVNVYLNLDLSGFFRPGEIARKIILDNEDIHLFLSYQPATRIGESAVVINEGVRVRIINNGLHVYNNLLPFSAIHQDHYSGVHFVFVVRRHESMLGREYFVEQTNILLNPRRPNIGHLANVMLPDLVGVPVVMMSERDLHCGDRVRIFD